MSLGNRIKKYFERIREKHKLSFTNDATYDEKWSFRLSMMNLYTLLSLYTIIIIFLLFVLLRFTSLSTLFVGLPPASSVEQINENSVMIDSLQNQVRSRQMYLDNLKKILMEEPFNDSLGDSNTDSTFMNYQADFNKSEEDSLLRYKVENDGKNEPEVTYDFFSAPVKGTVSKSYNKKVQHYGVDVVTEKNAPVKSCLEGTVVFAGWTPNEGEVIIVQHNNDFISVYKHCASILKKTGDRVQTADPMGIVGNSGKHSSGPHLHFEIWKKGLPLDPQEFINFQK